MDRAEAIKVLETEITCAKQETCERIECEKCELVMPLEKVLGAFGMAIAALREQEQLARNSHDVATPCKWISVEERLPEKEGKCVVLDTVLGVQVYYYHPDMVCSNWMSVTHWMPLPMPPKEGAEG